MEGHNLANLASDVVAKYLTGVQYYIKCTHYLSDITKL